MCMYTFLWTNYTYRKINLIIECPRPCVLQISHEDEHEGLLPDCSIGTKETRVKMIQVECIAWQQGYLKTQNNGRTEYWNNGITFKYRKSKCFELCRHGTCNWSSKEAELLCHCRGTMNTGQTLCSCPTARTKERRDP